MQHQKGTVLCRVIQEGKATVVDEAPMTNKLAFEALDSTLRDLTGKSQPMGCCCVGTLDRSYQLFRVVLEVTLWTLALKVFPLGPHNS